jgi:hypothetical protein
MLRTEGHSNYVSVQPAMFLLLSELMSKCEDCVKRFI